MSEDEAEILWHTLGIDRERREPWRNYYCAEAGASDMEALVASGLMVRGATINSGEDRYYHATDEGKASAIAALPEPEKLTRSQRRYRRYLRVSDFVSFREFLRSPESRL